MEQATRRPNTPSTRRRASEEEDVLIVYFQQLRVTVRLSRWCLQQLLMLIIITVDSRRPPPSLLPLGEVSLFLVDVIVSKSDLTWKAKV